MSIKNTFLQIGLLGKIWQQKSNHKIFIWNIIFIAFQLLFLIFRFNALPDQLPLYYSLPWGESQFASTVSLFLLPTFSIVFLLINHLLATFFVHNIKIFSRLLILTSFIFSLFSSITIFKIITLLS
jgi:hypothetical protein